MAGIAKIQYPLNFLPKCDANKRPIHVSQYDAGLTTIEFTCLYGKDGIIAFEPGMSVQITGLKPDDHVFVYPVESEVGTNIARILTQEQMTAAAGTVECELIIFRDDGERLGSANFKIEVEKAPVDDDVVSESDLSTFAQMLEKADDAIASAVAAAVSEENAAESANAAGNSEAAADAAAVAAAASAEAAARSAEAAAASQSAAKTSETNAKASETSAKTSEANAAESLVNANAAVADAKGYAEAALEYAAEAAGYAGESMFRMGIDPATGHIALYRYE